MKYYCYPKMSFKQVMLRGSISLLLLILVFLAIFLPLLLTGSLDSINSVSELKELILRGRGKSIFIFAVLQFLQVTFLPIPSVFTTLAGTMIFGPWTTLGISFISVMIGSLFSFFLGRKLGKGLVFWVAGYRKGTALIKKVSKAKYLFFLMMLFPFFPDDLLCLVAGVTNMSYGFFIFTNIITRPFGIIPTCFFGSGQIIPFSGWGIPVWIVLIILIGITFFLSIKFQAQIEIFFNKLLRRHAPKEEEKKCLLKNKHLIYNKHYLSSL